MPWIETAGLDPETLDSETRHQVYCAIDAMITPEILYGLKRDHGGARAGHPIYPFELALQAPLLEVCLRGFRVDGLERRSAELAVRRELQEVEDLLNELAMAVWGKPLNANSPQQLNAFFYKTMGIPEVWLSFRGERRVSTNREALEKISDYMYARPLVSLILDARDLTKQLSVLTQEIDADGRFRTSYNIGGTESGRLSSNSSAFGTGGNAQNITEKLRRVFVADPGWKLGVIDEEQVEARDTGFLLGCLFGDWTLLDSCEDGDFHTNNAKLCWPELPWPGDSKGDRELAERVIAYRDWSVRDLSKRGGHLSNYYGTAWTMSRVLKIPLGVCEEFQARYARGRVGKPGKPPITAAFPALPRYWQWTAEQLQTTRRITTPFGRTRDFFGRPGDDATLREAIAFVPQSMTADRTNLWLWRVWKRMGNRIQLLAQTHDSITFQYPEDANEEEIIQEINDLLAIPLVDPKSGRVYTAPGAAKVGWNWGNGWTEGDNEGLRKRGKPPRALNPGGLQKWKPGKRDLRVRPSGFDRLMGVGK